MAVARSRYPFTFQPTIGPSGGSHPAPAMIDTSASMINVRQGAVKISRRYTSRQSKAEVDNLVMKEDEQGWSPAV
jgi:hypothetical protein